MEGKYEPLPSFSRWSGSDPPILKHCSYMQTCVQEELKQCSYMQTCVQEELKLSTWTEAVSLYMQTYVLQGNKAVFMLHTSARSVQLALTPSRG